MADRHGHHAGSHDAEERSDVFRAVLRADADRGTGLQARGEQPGGDGMRFAVDVTVRALAGLVPSANVDHGNTLRVGAIDRITEISCHR